MRDKLKDIENRYLELEKKLSDPEIYSDPARAAVLLKEQKELTPVVEAYREYAGYLDRADEAREMLSGQLEPDFRELVQDEFDTSREKAAQAEQRIKMLLLPSDPNDSKNVIIEIRGGAGGDEAALFAASLYRMYCMYAERMRWKTEIININETELGGIKEVSFMINGSGAWSRLKFESGVHRVQRVPDTETSGRIHTSTVTVAVLPEMEDVDVQVNTADLQVDTYRASGAGGQHINKTDSAIRITHIPTGIIVECQDERSQFKNRDKAMKLLRARLYEAERQRINSEMAAERKSQVGTGDRSERIRTYNFPQGRLTDHRIGLTLYKLEAVVNGDLDEIIDALITADQTERMKTGESSTQ